MFIKRQLSAYTKYSIIFSTFAAAVFILNSCQQTTAPRTVLEDVADGRLLAQKYCVSCHQLPDPALLDKKNWEIGVLPAMGKNLGVRMLMGQYFTDKDAPINIVDWQRIVAYYKNTAPVALVIPRPAVAPLRDMAYFTVERPEKVNLQLPAMTTLLAFNPNDGKLYSSDAMDNLFTWNSNLNADPVAKFASPVTGIIFNKTADSQNNAVVTAIGQMKPINQSKGQVIQLDLGKKNAAQVIYTDSLPRPVESVAADFNKDGLTDYVVCGFGHDNGATYLLTQQPDHHFKKSIVRGIPGGEQMITGDFNNDGWPDVMCLFAQADEGLWMFLNDHKGGFISQNMMHFPAIFGSSSFQLVDFNHDGKPDLLYTAGDNSDYSKVLKPYHGVYIFTNQGNWKFKQTYFYHINGATKAIAADFKHTGELDLAVIAFFADFKKHPEEGFTFLEQTAPNKFTAHEMPVNQYGHWLTMTVGDMDHDGNADIVLGNFSPPGRGMINPHGFVPTWDQHEPIIVLKNNYHKK